jgi:DNA-binding transcriptional ArsR family regulator
VWQVARIEMKKSSRPLSNAHFGILVPSLLSSDDSARVPLMPADDCTDVLRALADRTRQRIVKALLTADLGVNELTEQLGLSQYNTSKHLRVLKEAGIVEVRAIAQRREYFIATTFRRRLEEGGVTLDFGCCTFRMNRLPD